MAFGRKGSWRTDVVVLVACMSLILHTNLFFAVQSLSFIHGRLPDHDPLTFVGDAVALPPNDSTPVFVSLNDSLSFHLIHTSTAPHFESNGVKPSLAYTRRVYERSDTLTEVYVDFPPFYWALPLGLDKSDTQRFWAQPENFQHFNDSLAGFSSKVQIFKNHRLTGSFKPVVNRSHYRNYNGPICEPCDDPQIDVMYFMMSHDTHYFQHFLDNGMPHMTLMELASGFDPSNVTFVMKQWISGCVPYLLTRYGFKEIHQRHGANGLRNDFCAKTLVLPEIVPVVHPILTQHFIDGLKLNHAVADTIILISRNQSDQSKYERIITNQDDLADQLKSKYGDKFVLFRPVGFSTAESIELFQRAEVVIGSHGGAMYNALWASRGCKVIEILPLLENGAYPDQRHPQSAPTFAHLAFHTNSMMNFQRYYRYYARATAINYPIDLQHFMEWLARVVS
jgi:hypothetical protein